jgi:regulator of CtrA degradation
MALRLLPIRYGRPPVPFRDMAGRRGMRGGGMSSQTSFEGAQAISFAERLAASQSFAALFREGMSLVEEAACYLDGPGRRDSQRLSRAAAVGYAAESMRLTTRLMQLASWLLLRRAVNEGELSRTQAATEKHKVRLARQEIAARPDVFDQLPDGLKRLSLRSMRLQARVLYLDQLLYGAPVPRPEPSQPRAVALQHDLLRAAFVSQAP